MLIEENFSLKDHHTFHLDVSASYKASITKPEELMELYTLPRYRTVKKLILGGGSNVLFTRNFLGLVVKMEIPGIEVIEETDDSVW